MTRIGAVIFPEFELLDLFGPLEMLGMLPGCEISLIAESLEPVASAQGPRSIPDVTLDADARYEILLVPGGPGTRSQVANSRLIAWLRLASGQARITASVCTGAALLAAAGLLDNRRATTNKRAWAWATGFGRNVDWQGSARWVNDGDIFTSSGVSAGIDMSLALIANLTTTGTAEEIAAAAEYVWQNDPADDPFAIDLDK